MTLRAATAHVDGRLPVTIWWSLSERCYFQPHREPAIRLDYIIVRTSYYKLVDDRRQLKTQNEETEVET